MTLKRSSINDVFPPQIGNVLATFVDINDGQLKLKDQAGNVTTLSAYTGGGGGAGIIIEGTGAGSSIRCGLTENAPRHSYRIVIGCLCPCGSNKVQRCAVWIRSCFRLC